jgi:uncharacterized protein
LFVNSEHCMNNQQILEILADQKESFNRERVLIDREVDLTKYIKTSQVVVITGVRRCGKSSLLYLISRKLKLDEADYCYVNFDDERLVKSVEVLNQIYLLHIETYRKEPVFFFDEIQNIPQWEQFVNRMYEKGLKLFLTGSNATLLSSEIASSLTGRNKTLELYPFSFAEFLKYEGIDSNLDKQTSKNKSLMRSTLKDYMQIGGFPLIVKEKDLELINNYFQDILYRDIIARYRIIQVNEIKQIALYLISNVGKLYSYATLQKVAGIKSSQSVKSYVDYLQDSFLLYFLKKFDYSVKKQMMNSRKAYVIDPALCHRLGFSFSENSGRILENIVLLHLLRKGAEVYYHKEKKECDFVVKSGLKITAAIQVCENLHIENYVRELEGLSEAIHSYGLEKGILICNHNSLQEDLVPKNIQLISASEWLLTN